MPVPGKSNVYGGLPFSYLAGSDNPHSGVGLRKEGVYGSRNDVHGDPNYNRVLKSPGEGHTGRDSGLGRSNHSTGERGWLPPASGDPETGIGYDNQGYSEIDFGSNTRMQPANDNFILMKGPNDPNIRHTPRAVERSPSPMEEPVVLKGQPISSDFYDPPVQRDTDVDGGSGYEDLERVPKVRPTIFSLAQEAEKEEREERDQHGFSSGLSGYPSYVKDPKPTYTANDSNNRPSTSSDEFNNMIRTDSYMSKDRDPKACSRCCIIIIVLVTVIICLGIGFVAGWFGFQAMNPSVIGGTTMSVAGGVSTTTTTPAPASSTSTTTTTTTTTTPMPTQAPTAAPTPAPTPPPTPPPTQAPANPETTTTV